MDRDHVEYQISNLIALTSTFAQVHLVAIGRFARVSMIHISNGDSGAVLISLCLVSSGVTPAITNALLWQFSLAANDFIELGEGFEFGPGKFLMAAASKDNVVTVQMSGIERFKLGA